MTDSLPQGHLLRHHDKQPTLGLDVFIAPTAAVIGDVHLADGVSIWFGAVLRGDETAIYVGRGTNIQDNCVVHSNPGDPPVRIGDSVTVGHGAIIHGATVGNGALIGMGAVVLDGAHVGEGSMVAAGAVVSPNKKIGSNELWAGCPARKIRDISERELGFMRANAGHYEKQAAHYRSGRAAYLSQRNEV